MEADPLEIARELIDEHEHAQSRHREGFNPLAPDPRAADVAQALIAKHAEVGRLREALTHLDRILAFSPVSHQTREFVRAALAQEAGK